MRRHIYYTLQSLLHKQGSNAIKIVSLALGLLMSVFLFARIAFELSFDNFYHDSDNLYIVKTGWLKNGVLEGNESRFTIIPIPAAIAEEFPEQVESSTVSCSLFDNSFQLGERQLDMSTVMADTLYFFCTRFGDDRRQSTGFGGSGCRIPFCQVSKGGLR